MSEPAIHPVVLFDGVCNLCNAWVRWVIARDPEGTFRLVSLQSNAARELLAARLTEEEIQALPDSIVLIDRDGVHTRSTAPLRVTGRLGWPWKAVAALQLVPRPVRDLVYGWIAKHRYRWFGRRDACAVPTPETAERFLDADEPKLPIAAPDPAERGRSSRA